MQKALLLSASFHPFFALVTSRLDCSPIGEQMAMCFSREDLMALMSPEEMAKAQRCARPVRMRDVFPMLPSEYHALRRRVQVGESLVSVALAAVGDVLDTTAVAVSCTVPAVQSKIVGVATYCSHKRWC